MKAKDITRGLVVAVGTNPGDKWARRAIVIDQERMWNDRSNRWDRKPLYAKGRRDSFSKYAIAVEQPDHDGGPSIWVPKLAGGREILAPWDEHLDQVETAAERRAEEDRRRRTETDKRIAWHQQIEARAKALGVRASGRYTDWDVTITGDDMDRLLVLAEAGAQKEN